jgi:flagellar hook-associated protein 1 FlgK
MTGSNALGDRGTPLFSITTITVTAGAANAGSAEIEVTLANDATPAPDGYRLVLDATGFTLASSDGSASVSGAGTLVLDGSFIPGTGFGFSPAGMPVAGDSFRLLPTGAGCSDNGNARALALVRDATAASGTLEASLDVSLSGIASRLAETDRLAETVQGVRDDSARATDAVSEVDINQEAAELTRLQAAYRANAQVIAAARDMLDTLLGIAR